MEAKKLIQIFILIFLFPCIHFGQTQLFEYNPKKVRKELQKVVEKMVEGGGIDSEVVGFELKRTQQYNRFEKLTQIATTAELVALMKYPNTTVRGYTFWALAKRHYNKLDKIFIAHANDEALVIFMDGCLIEELPLIKFMDFLVTPNMLCYDCKKFNKKTFLKMHKASKGIYENHKE